MGEATRLLSPTPHLQYRPIPTTPATTFALALLVPLGVTAQQVEGVMRANGGSLLEAVDLFDSFAGAGVPDDARSLAWRLTFRHPQRTIDASEMHAQRAALLDALALKLGVRLR